jgi:hypothetical protein
MSTTIDLERLPALPTRKQTADILQTSVDTVDRLIDRGVLKRVKVSPRLVRVTGDSIREHIKQGSV